MSQDQPPPAVPDQPAPLPPSNDPGGLRGFIARARGQTRGDVIAANVGAGAENVAVGKFILQNNVRIGTLVVPIRFIAVLVVLALVVALAAWYLLVPATMAEHDVNIAVADFGQRDANGGLSSSTQGKQLSEWLFNKLRDESADLPGIFLWHDSMNLLQKRAIIGAIPDETAAAKLANDINARIVIYGNLAPNQDPATFTPQFYVRQKKGEADELTGSQQLGKPLPLPTPFNPEYLNLNLEPRARALVWFARGISLDLLGEYGESYKLFKQAEQNLSDWQNDQGKEVLYYFLGREALFMGQTDAGAQLVFTSAAEATDAAEQSFRKALAIQPNYARAHFGLGQALVQRAQRVVLNRSADAASLDAARADLNAAIKEFQQALTLAAQSSGSLVAQKTTGALGAAYIALGESYLANGAPAQAEPFFRTAGDTLQPLPEQIPHDEARLRAQSYLTLGTATYLQGAARLAQGDKANAQTLYQSARQQFDQCFQLAVAQQFDNFLKDTVAPNCSKQRADLDKALAGL